MKNSQNVCIFVSISGKPVQSYAIMYVNIWKQTVPCKCAHLHTHFIMEYDFYHRHPAIF